MGSEIIGKLAPRSSDSSTEFIERYRVHRYLSTAAQLALLGHRIRRLGNGTDIIGYRLYAERGCSSLKAKGSEIIGQFVSLMA